MYGLSVLIVLAATALAVWTVRVYESRCAAAEARCEELYDELDLSTFLHGAALDEIVRLRAEVARLRESA